MTRIQQIEGTAFGVRGKVARLASGWPAGGPSKVLPRLGPGARLPGLCEGASLDRMEGADSVWPEFEEEI
jgi:hypothetical protein